MKSQSYCGAQKAEIICDLGIKEMPRNAHFKYTTIKIGLSDLLEVLRCNHLFS